MPQTSKESPTRTQADTSAGSAGHAQAQPDLETLSAHYRSAYDRLYRQALGIVGSPEIAAEVVQDAYADTIQKLKEGCQIRHLGGWFRTVIRNGALQRLHERPTLPLPEDYVLRSPHSVTDIAHSRERCRDLYGVVEQLGPAQRSAFLLAELRGLDYSEIASNLGRSEHAVRSLLTRARKYVRATLDTDYPAIATPLVFVHEAVARSAARLRGAGNQLLARLADLHAWAASLAQRVAPLAHPAEALAASALVVAVLGTSAISVPVAGHDGTNAAPAPAVAPAPDGTGGSPAAAGGDPGSTRKAPANLAPTADAQTPSADTGPGARPTGPGENGDRTTPEPGAAETAAPASSSTGTPPTYPSGGSLVTGDDPPPAQDYNGPGFGDPGSEQPPAQDLFGPPPLLDPPEHPAPPPQPAKPHLGEPRPPGSEPVREPAAREQRAEPDPAPSGAP